MIRIAIADDHPLIRKGLAKLTEREIDMELVHEYQDTHHLLKHFDADTCDILVLDISFPDSDGLDMLERIRAVWPALNILVMSMHPEEQYALRAMKAGARGYISKNSPSVELIDAIRKIARGARYYSETVVDKMAGGYLQETTNKPHDQLTNREFQVFMLLARGLSVQEISRLLVLSSNTVYTFRRRIFEKMNLQTNAGLIHYAVQNNLVN